eukprot:358159-Chlamydomonas_euryale.AAC.5
MKLSGPRQLVCAGGGSARTFAATFDRHSLFVWRAAAEISHPLTLHHTKPFTVRPVALARQGGGRQLNAQPRQRRCQCAHACVHACVCARVRACVPACACACVLACLHACMHACIGACSHSCMYGCMHTAYMHGCMRARVQGREACRPSRLWQPVQRGPLGRLWQLV